MRLARDPRLTAPALLAIATAPPEEARAAPVPPEAEAAEASVAREEADDWSCLAARLLELVPAADVLTTVDVPVLLEL